MEVVPAIGKLSRVSPQTDSLSVSVRPGNLRDHTRKHILSESFALKNTSIRDETKKDPVVADPSPGSKRVRFAVSLVGRWLTCPADLQVGNTQVYSPLLVCSESVSMMNAALVMKGAVSIIINMEVCTLDFYRVVRDRPYACLLISLCSYTWTHWTFRGTPCNH